MKKFIANQRIERPIRIHGFVENPDDFDFSFGYQITIPLNKKESVLNMIQSPKNLGPLLGVSNVSHTLSTDHKRGVRIVLKGSNRITQDYRISDDGHRMWYNIRKPQDSEVGRLPLPVKDYQAQLSATEEDGQLVVRWQGAFNINYGDNFKSEEAEEFGISIYDRGLKKLKFLINSEQKAHL